MLHLGSCVALLGILAFAGFKGFVSFAKEVDASVSSPVFNLSSELGVD